MMFCVELCQKSPSSFSLVVCYFVGFGIDFVSIRFAGRDGTKGFVTGDFTEAGLVDDLDGLDATLFQGFEEWLDFYEKTYTFVGEWGLDLVSFIKWFSFFGFRK